MQEEITKQVEDDISNAIHTIYELPNRVGSNSGDIIYASAHKKKNKTSRSIFSDKVAVFEKNQVKNLEGEYGIANSNNQRKDADTFFAELENYKRFMQSQSEPERGSPTGSGVGR